MGESNKIHTIKFNSKKLCEIFNISGATIYEETYECISSKIPFSSGMLGRKHSEETKRKMSEKAKGRDMKKAIQKSAEKRRGKPAFNKGHIYPHLQKGGKIISKEGEIIQFNCISHISKELNLNPAHLGQVLAGKRKSHKGWKNAQ